MKLGGKFVDGVMYDFEDGVCTKETQLINGWEEIELEWHRNGALNIYLDWPEQPVGGGFVFDGTNKLTRFTAMAFT